MIYTIIDYHDRIPKTDRRMNERDWRVCGMLGTDELMTRPNTIIDTIMIGIPIHDRCTNLPQFESEGDEGCWGLLTCIPFKLVLPKPNDQKVNKLSELTLTFKQTFCIKHYLSIYGTFYM